MEILSTSEYTVSSTVARLEILIVEGRPVVMYLDCLEVQLAR